VLSLFLFIGCSNTQMSDEYVGSRRNLRWNVDGFFVEDDKHAAVFLYNLDSNPDKSPDCLDWLGREETCEDCSRSGVSAIAASSDLYLNFSWLTDPVYVFVLPKDETLGIPNGSSSGDQWNYEDPEFLRILAGIWEDQGDSSSQWVFESERFYARDSKVSSFTAGGRIAGKVKFDNHPGPEGEKPESAHGGTVRFDVGHCPGIEAWLD
jgi:hypothetical protein